MSDTPLQRRRLDAGRVRPATEVATDLTAGTQSQAGLLPVGARTNPRRRPRSVDGVSRSRLTIIALVSLLTTALLGLAVSRGYGAYRLEWRAMRLLGHASNIARWADLADFLAAPVIVTLVVVSVIVGARHRIPLRVVAFAGFRRGRAADQRARRQAGGPGETPRGAQLPLGTRHRRLRHGAGHVDRALSRPREVGPRQHLRPRSRAGLCSCRSPSSAPSGTPHSTTSGRSSCPSASSRLARPSSVRCRLRRPPVPVAPARVLESGLRSGPA